MAETPESWLSTAVFDVEGSKPRTGLQRFFANSSEIATNASLAVIAMFIAYMGIIYICSTFLVDYSIFGYKILAEGPLGILMPQSSMLRGLIAILCLSAVLAVRILQRLKRYQIFALIGLANVASAFYENAKPLLLAAKTGKIDQLAGGFLVLLKAFVN